MELGWMLAPVVACVLMALMLGWFGLHVLQRGVIFVDLALAQIAALGTTYAVFLGHDPDEPMAYVFGLLFTVIGAVSFAMARHFEDRVPQEALIGIAYVVCAGGGAMLIDFASDPHGAEKLQHLLVGNVVWVQWSEIGAIAAIIGVVAALHAARARTLLEVTHSPDEAADDGLWVALWDLFFYLTFGVVITAIVHIAGVLLIFSFLVIPAVIARLFASSVGARLAIAWGVSVPLSILGVGISYEHAAGPAIVVLLGAALLISLAVVALRRSEQPARLALGIAAVILTAGAGHLVASGLSAELAHGEHDEHHHELAPAPVHDDLPAGASTVEREVWYRAHLDHAGLLADALIREEDPSLRLLLASALVQAGDGRGVAGLVELTRSEVPFMRMEADDRLRLLAGDQAPAFDPLASADEAGVWAAWAGGAGDTWTARAAQVALP